MFQAFQPDELEQLGPALVPLGGGHRMLGLAHEMGTLAPGYLADLVVFDFRHAHLTPLLDPLGTLVHDGCGRDVEHVFIDGRQVLAGGVPTLVDAGRIRADAQRAAESLWARARAEVKQASA